MFKGIFEALAGNLVIIWVMFVLCPVYLVLGNLIANFYKNIWLMVTSRQSWVYKNLGDLSWLFPFTQSSQQIRLTDTLLISVLCGVLSLLIVVAMVYNNMQEKNQKRLEREIKEEMDKKKN
ncbi:hypothetical protein ABPG74_022635 [Tetrahymena malaccensis]